MRLAHRIFIARSAGNMPLAPGVIAMVNGNNNVPLLDGSHTNSGILTKSGIICLFGAGTPESLFTGAMTVSGNGATKHIETTVDTDLRALLIQAIIPSTSDDDPQAVINMPLSSGFDLNMRGVILADVDRSDPWRDDIVNNSSSVIGGTTLNAPSCTGQTGDLIVTFGFVEGTASNPGLAPSWNQSTTGQQSVFSIDDIWIDHGAKVLGHFNTSTNNIYSNNGASGQIAFACRRAQFNGTFEGIGCTLNQAGDAISFVGALKRGPFISDVDSDNTIDVSQSNVKITGDWFL